MIVSIPLLDNNDKFEIFDISNIPVPMNDTTISTEKLPNMIACYRLETQYIAINFEKMQYALITTTEQEHCTSLLTALTHIMQFFYCMIFVWNLQ